MIKELENLDYEELPLYELTRGNSFSFKSEIKDGINADKVAMMTARIYDECWNIVVEQDFFQQSDVDWYLYITSETTQKLKVGDHHMHFDVKYSDGSVSTIYKADVYVVHGGNSGEEGSNDC